MLSRLQIRLSPLCVSVLVLRYLDLFAEWEIGPLPDPTPLDKAESSVKNCSERLNREAVQAEKIFLDFLPSVGFYYQHPGI